MDGIERQEVEETGCRTDSGEGGGNKDSRVSDLSSW